MTQQVHAPHGTTVAVVDSVLDALLQLPGTAEDELQTGLAHLRGLPRRHGASLGWVVHKSTAVR